MAEGPVLGMMAGAPLLLTNLRAQVVRAGAAGALAGRNAASFIEALRELAGLLRRA
jgi:hypothetical protein